MSLEEAYNFDDADSEGWKPLTKGKRWEIAQFHERDHWERFIKYCPQGGERYWLKLWASQAEVLWRHINSLREVTGETRILGVGSGAIGHLRWFKAGQLFILDPLADLFKDSFPELSLDEYGLREDVTFFAAAAERLQELSLEPFDITLLLNCLDHCENPNAVLSNIHAILKPQGLLFEATTAYDAVCTHQWAAAKYHPWTFLHKELTDLITEAGFIWLLTSKEWVGQHGPGYNEELHIWEKV